MHEIRLGPVLVISLQFNLETTLICDDPPPQPLKKTLPTSSLSHNNWIDFPLISLFVSLFHIPVSASQRDSSSSKDNKADAYGKNGLDLDAFKIGPYFDKAASKNVTALLGKTAYLNCRVKNLGNKTVSATTNSFSRGQLIHSVSRSIS